MDISELFGKPKDESECPWDTGFMISVKLTNDILDRDKKKTGYSIISGSDLCIVDSKGTPVAFISDGLVREILTLGGESTGYHIGLRKGRKPIIYDVGIDSEEETEK